MEGGIGRRKKLHENKKQGEEMGFEMLQFLLAEIRRVGGREREREKLASFLSSLRCVSGCSLAAGVS